MPEVVSIKFRNRGKLYFFDPAGLTLKAGDDVVAETAKGLEMGSVLQGNHQVPEEQVVSPLRPVARAATDDDRRIAELCRQREREAYVIGKQKIAAHGLDMKLVDVECSFEGSKIIFFFSSEGRVDFRELVKDLAGVFRTRIELRQIGVRDEARMLGGLGICGRPFCCGSFMGDFQPVSTKMAKTQSLSLNPTKISGCCGRLMCCLRYEQSAYEELVKTVPKTGAFVETPDGYGNAIQVNILRQTVRVRLDGTGDDTVRQYDADEVAAVPGGRPRDGSEPPHVLVLKPKAPKEEPEPEWEMPEIILNSQAEPIGRPMAKREPRHPRQETPAQDTPPAESAPKRQNRQQRSKGKGPNPPRGDRQSQGHGQAQGHGQSQRQGQPGQEKNRPPKKSGSKGQRPKQEGGSGGEKPPANAQGAKPKKPYYRPRRPYNSKPRPKQEGGNPAASGGRGGPAKEG